MRDTSGQGRGNSPPGRYHSSLLSRQGSEKGSLRERSRAERSGILSDRPYAETPANEGASQFGKENLDGDRKGN